MQLLIASLAGYYTIVCAAAGSAEDAARVASELVGAASPTRESKQQFFQRFGASYRRLVATELMAQEVVGYEWRTMTPSQQAEITQLYEKIVMAALHGAYDAALPARFILVDSAPYRSQAGKNKKRCTLLQMTDCNFYSAKTKASDVTVEYRLIETKSGWQVADLLINEKSVQEIYETSIQEVLKFGTESALDKLRARVSQY